MNVEREWEVGKKAYRGGGGGVGGLFPKKRKKTSNLKKHKV
jgi:hypothetical protein